MRNTPCSGVARGSGSLCRAAPTLACALSTTAAACAALLSDLIWAAEPMPAGGDERSRIGRCAEPSLQDAAATPDAATMAAISATTATAATGHSPLPARALKPRIDLDFPTSTWSGWNTASTAAGGNGVLGQGWSLRASRRLPAAIAPLLRTALPPRSRIHSRIAIAWTASN